MSIFGQLDAAAIPTNPYWVEQGEYSAEVTKAFYKENRDGQRQLVIEYTINEENSQFNNFKVQQYFGLVDPDMTLEGLSLLPPDEQKKIRQSNAALKRTLCGSDSNANQKGLGVNIEDLNDADWNPESLVGTRVDIGISNYGKTNEGVNVKWANLQSE
jgi:hypothetical protein